jgi:hypothetical protein
MNFESFGFAQFEMVDNVINNHYFYWHHKHLSNIDCLSFVMCPLLAPLVIGFFSFFFAAAVYSTKEANKAGGMCH